MLRANEALRIILDGVDVLEGAEVALADALGAVLAADVVARDDVPPFSNSGMDGFAVRASDVSGATADNPVRLRVLEDVPAGQVASQPVTAGTAIRIMTGAAMPDGADCVVRVEDTRGEGDGVLILQGVKRGRNVRPAGEDAASGQVVLCAGTLLRAAEAGVLATVGQARVMVVRQARVAVITTGDELVDVDEKPGPGKIRDANSYTLMAQVKLAGGKPLLHARVADERQTVRETFERALQESDLVVTNGGVSVGDYDFVKVALEDMGAELRFFGVNQKPGKPLAFWQCKGKPVVSLPGYPVSAMVCFEEYVRPLLRKMMGHSKLHRPWREAELEGGYRKPGDRRLHLLRVKAWRQDGTWRARSTGGQGSGLLSTMAAANALAIVPEDADEVTRVQVHLTDLPEEH